MFVWQFVFVYLYVNDEITSEGLDQFTGGHRRRVAAVTLDNMAEEAAAASASLRQILILSVRYCGPAFVCWLSMLWDTVTRKPDLQ